MDIISKFTVGSEEGISDLITIIDSSTYSLHKDFVSEDKIQNYIKNEIDPRKMINDLNDLSNQLIMTYADQRPVGYSILRSGSIYSGLPDGKRATEISFVILPEFDTQEIRQSLWKKSRSAASFTDIIWINMLAHDPLFDFFKESGFTVAIDSQAGPFQLPSHILTLEINKS
ncbi:hypothetical protein C1637_16090 [Chryseobacterium lactis]|uniref:N-acetyltransferase n=1 Tax=Chryseobacterium lactis TaxID=1241981 RepID=A0A3G6RMK1_CHRLC|nr:hypothetical protein [Chryseobacterium lactis]AZA84013.1 hypothetical protein EG342_19930 [Chryseobacterium lactis]AZB04399.1 hypothetical protein EG341_10805 [Chryseobacterium lactis]PNW12568.1 hypothetical protein C1637_16090 [Chryseobacterium lactis]